MNEFRSSVIYKKSLFNIYKFGKTYKPRDLEIKEEIDFHLKIHNPYNLGFDLKDRKFNFKYLLCEIIWYLSGDLKTDFIGEYASLWKKISDKNGKVNSNYGYIVFYKKLKDWNNQYEYILDILKNDKDSRQAIIRYNSDEHSYLGNKDFVCTLSNQFFIRDDSINIIVNMRSNDMFYGFSYDLPWFGLLLQSLLIDLKQKYINLKIGKIYWNTGSAHIYSNMFDKTEEIFKGRIEDEIDYNFILKKSFTEIIPELYYFKEKIKECKNKEDYKILLEKIIYIENGTR